MKRINIPYYTSFLPLHIDENNLIDVIYPKTDKCKFREDEQGLILEAMESPIGSLQLSELAVEKNKVVIVTSDHTRAVPSRITLPILIKEIRKGNPAADIVILIATGLHRATTEAEQRRMFGDDIVDKEKIAINISDKPDDFEYVCDLPSGAQFWVNKLALQCDLLVTEGFIEPHFFAGFSGGRKSILPGICNTETVKENHSYKAIAHVNSIAGRLEGNPIHLDMLYAARAVNVQFILNVALNDEKKVIAAFAGDLEQAHDKGVEFVRNQAEFKAIHADIVVTSNGGYPLDQNLYQSAKAVSTAEICTNKDGVIIMCCSCCDGMGGEYFEKLILKGLPEEIDNYLSGILPNQTIPEQWCAQIYSRILKKYNVILVTDFLEREIVKKANMIPASTPDEALDIAYGIKGRDAKVLVIPDGVAVLAV